MSRVSAPVWDPLAAFGRLTPTECRAVIAVVELHQAERAVLATVEPGRQHLVSYVAEAIVEPSHRPAA